MTIKRHKTFPSMLCCFLFKQIAYLNPNDDSYLLAIPSRDQLRSLLSYMLDEDEFLSPYGIRSVSRYHEKHPYELDLDGNQYKVDYVPGESNTYMFGGNSNWRGPIWFCGKYNQINSTLAKKQQRDVMKTKMASRRKIISATSLKAKSLFKRQWIYRLRAVILFSLQSTIWLWRHSNVTITFTEPVSKLSVQPVLEI